MPPPSAPRSDQSIQTDFQIARHRLARYNEVVSTSLTFAAMPPIPFTIPFAAHLAKADGLLRFDGTALLLEFESRDALVGVLKSDLREVRVPVAEINAVELHKGFLSTTLDVQTSTLRATRGVPGATQGRFTLTISRKDSPAVEILTRAVRGAMSSSSTDAL